MGDLLDEAGKRAEGEEEKASLLACSLFGTEEASDPPEARMTPPEKGMAHRTLKRLLKGTNDRSAPSPDGITWRLLKVAMRTPLGEALTSQIAMEVREGGRKEWLDSRVVLLPKPGRDLTKPNSWRPISLINVISKWVDRWVAEDIQREAHHLLHERQMGSRKGRLAQDALTRLLA